MKFVPLIWHNLTRNKLRSLLTGSAIALAVALVCLLRTMPDGLDSVLSRASSNTRLNVHNKAGLVYSLPYAYLQRVQALPGVDAVASWTWFGGVFEEERGVTFPNFATEPDRIAQVFPDWEIPEERIEEFRRRRNGALVGDMTMDRYGWELGDLITLKGTVFPVELELRIVGTFPDRPMLFMQREYVDQALRAATGGQFRGLDWLGNIWVRVSDPARVDPLLSTIDTMFRNSEAETASETEKSFFRNFFSQLEGFVTIILIVTGLVALCIVFIAANTASMSVRERMGEIAVLRAVGFSRRLIFGTLVAEAALLSTVAGVAGAFASYGLTSLLRSDDLINTMGPLAAFQVTGSILVQGVFLALFVGMLSGVVPSFGAARRSVAATLREVF